MAIFKIISTLFGCINRKKTVLIIFVVAVFCLIYLMVNRELREQCLMETLLPFVKSNTPSKDIDVEYLFKKKPKRYKLCGGEKLIGRVTVNQSKEKSISSIENSLSTFYGFGNVEKGGWFDPKECQSNTSVAIIVPYRNRYEQLKIFLRYMHAFLQRQQISYRMFIVQQMFNDPFNRAGLLNIGFKEALKFHPFECFVLTDVDLLPENDHNSYGCPHSPYHHSVAIDYANYELLYENNFGGCSAFRREDFENINGMSNLYWGWGGEDDDLYDRIIEKGMKLHRPALEIGTYTQLQFNHFRSSDPDPNRWKILADSTRRMKIDGLNSLRYELLEIKEHLLYTNIKVRLKKQTYQNVFRKCYR